MPLAVFVAISSRDPMRGMEKCKISKQGWHIQNTNALQRLNIPLAIGCDTVANLPNHNLVPDVVVFRDELHQSLNQIRLVAADSELRRRPDGLVQRLYKSL